jgi:outer membrane protein assembly factor BamB
MSLGLVMLDVDASSVLSLDRSSGRELWNTHVTPLTGNWTSASYAGDSTTAAAITGDVNDRIQTFEVFALEAGSGRLRWRRTDSTDVRFRNLPRGVLVMNDTVWAFGTESLDRNSLRRRLFLYAYDGATGRSLFRSHSGDSASSTLRPPVHWNGLFVFGNNEGGLVAMDHAGRVVWRVRGRGIGPGESPSLMDGIAYAASADGTVRAVDIASGQQLWVTDLTYSLDAAVACGNSVYAQLLTELFRLDRRTGAVIGKETDDESGTRSRFYGPLISTPTAAYAGSRDGRLYRLPC